MNILVGAGRFTIGHRIALGDENIAKVAVCHRDAFIKRALMKRQSGARHILVEANFEIETNRSPGSRCIHLRDGIRLVGPVFAQSECA